VTDQALRYGVYLPPFGPFGDPKVLIDLAERAEAVGWDGVFLWDHLVYHELPIVDPWTTLAAMAQATKTIRLGPMVTPLARRRPWVVARQASTLSRISGGRLILGTGLGSDQSGDFSRFGESTDVRTRASRNDEGLEILEAVWSARPYQHSGEHYRVILEPGTPIPHSIPVWVARSVAYPNVIGRAARHNGIFPNPEEHTPSAAEITEIVAALRRSGLPADRPFDIAIAGNASPAWDEPPKVDLTALAQAGMTWWLESLIHFDPLELSLEIVDAGPPKNRP